MPPRPKSPCRRPGCPQITDTANGYCALCQDYADEQQRLRESRKQASTFYTRGQWPKVRAWYIGQHPVCEACRRARATEVDHIKEIRDGGARYAVSNLQALCHRCHMAKTAIERRRRGGGAG